jgi:hypothetical protein
LVQPIGSAREVLATQFYSDQSDISSGHEPTVPTVPTAMRVRSDCEQIARAGI